MSEKVATNSHKQLRKLSLSTKLLYGVGQLTDSISANVFVFFFIFFLTDIAGVKPATAGLVSLIAGIWDAVTDPIIGYYSDKIRWKCGRRRPFILIASVPIGIALWLLFTAVNFPETTKTVYYIGVSMFFYTAYTCYYVPFMALGAEITDDYNERTSVRFYCLAFQLLGVFVASTGTMVVVDKFVAITGSTQTAWSIAAGIFGAASTVAALISWNYTRGKESIVMEPEEEKGQSILKTLTDVAKIRSIRFLAIAVAIYGIGFSITSGIYMYLMNSVMHLDGDNQVVFFTFMSIVGLIIIPISNILGIKMGKRKAYIYLIVCSGAIQMLYSFFDFTFALLLVFCVVASFGHNNYFGLFQSMMYDCCEAYEYRTGLKKEGVITSIIFLFQKLGFALGMWLMGYIMELTGYIGDATQQTSEAVRGIKMLATVCAPAFFIISALIMTLYKLDGKTFDALKEALAKKKNNEQYDDSSFKDLI
ncbi:glycoside-pentoside-hexuronide (GPH):cation symporter [Clostridiaceae bacterium M8S5]|nr:glycoside-pentoside-hexuronide (GPH):cation symporter [Clostridiaceae bacterium M8S5]